ncbi:MAG: glycosyltransferase [Acidimicrobiia bacterium]
MTRGWRRMVPGPVKRMVNRYRTGNAGSGRSGGNSSQAARDLRKARQRIAVLKERTRSDGDRWARQLKDLVPRQSQPLDDLAYYPAGNWNAYMRLLYARAPEFGFAPRPLDRIERVDDLPPTSVLHLHWTRSAQVGAETVAEARAKTESFIEPIERFVARGGVLVWTIHEELPHDCRFPEVEVELRRRLAGLAHGIHVLHQSTEEAVAGLYPLDPAKVFAIEHPLYTGAYEDFVGRDAARALLDLPDDAVMLLGFGAIRHYKGFDRLVGLLPRLRGETGQDVRVMIAGRTLATDDNSGLRRLVSSTAGASMTEDGPPEAAVSILFRAADVVVLPYREFLNSGVLLLGLSFGVPVIVPRTAVSADFERSGLVRLFEATDDEDLARALREAVGHRVAVPRQVSAEVLERHDPHRIAGRFAEQAREIVTLARR